MNKTLLFALTSIILFNCQETSRTSIAFKDVNVEEFQSLMNSNPGLILDVRTEEEVEIGIIGGAIQLDFYGDDFDTKLKEFKRDQPVYVYCAAGGRSGKAMNKMMNLEFTEVYNLNGGMGAWKAHGMKTVKPW